MQKPYVQDNIEQISERVRIAHNGQPPFMLEFLHNGIWTNGVQFDDIHAARNAAEIAVKRSGSKLGLNNGLIKKPLNGAIRYNTITP